jgi:hypothetical protein
MLVAATAAACGGDGDKKIDVPGGGEVNVSDDLPDDFPDDFPIYDGADFEGSFSGEQDGVAGIVANWTTGDDIDEVRTFYDDEFSGDGDWTAETDGTTGDSSFWSVRNSSGDEAAFVTAATDGDKTNITVVISDDLNDLPADDGNDSSSGGDDSSSDDGSSSDADDSDSGDDPGSGDADLPEEVDLPDDFPSDVPLPDNIRVTNAFSSSTGGVDTFIVEFLSQDSIDDLSAHFKNEFEGKSWTQSFHSESNGQVFDTYAENDEGTGTAVTVTIYESTVSGYNTVALTVTSQ